MSHIEEVHQLTCELDTLLTQKITIKERADVIDTINHLIEKREQVMKHLQPPFNAEEIKMGQEIIKLNEQIEKNMNDLFSQLKYDMKQVQKQKKSNRTYINPYGKLKSTDGIYLDSKQ